MTAFRGPGVRQLGAVGTTPREHRLAIAGQYAENAPGIPRSGILVQSAANVVTLTADTGTLTYAVGALAAVIGREIDDGVYTPTATAGNKVNTTAAPASGSRWDLIWCRQNDAEKGDKLPVVGGVVDNSFIFGVTQGASAGTPTRPTALVPAGALVLAEARIFSGTTSTGQSPNTVTQVFPITAARGAAIPVRTTDERSTITAPAVGQRVKRLDKPGAPEQVWDGSSWTLPGEVPLVIPSPAPLVGSAAGLAAGLADGTIRPIRQEGSFVASTNGAGYATFDYPVPFPNGVMTALVCNGDSAQGRGMVVSTAGSPFTQSKSTLFVSAADGNGAGKANATIRVDYIVAGW